jgi:hypothetical protein
MCVLSMPGQHVPRHPQGPACSFLCCRLSGPVEAAMAVRAQGLLPCSLLASLNQLTAYSYIIFCPCAWATLLYTITQPQLTTCITSETDLTTIDQPSACAFAVFALFSWFLILESYFPVQYSNYLVITCRLVCRRHSLHPSPWPLNSSRPYKPPIPSNTLYSPSIPSLIAHGRPLAARGGLTSIQCRNRQPHPLL